jgi:hypothetical protein
MNHHEGRGKARAACLAAKPIALFCHKAQGNPPSKSIPFLIQEKERRRAGHKHKHANQKSKHSLARHTHAHLRMGHKRPNTRVRGYEYTNTNTRAKASGRKRSVVAEGGADGTPPPVVFFAPPHKREEGNPNKRVGLARSEARSGPPQLPHRSARVRGCVGTWERQ